MNWWEWTLTGIGVVIGAAAVTVVGVMAYFGWRMSNRGPF